MEIKVKHKKGFHYASLLSLAKLYWASLFKKKVLLTFDDNSKYDLKDNDQYDWCKCIGRGGLKTHKLIRKTEQFIVWRYIIEKDEFHVNRYWRKDYKMGWDAQYKVIKGSGSVLMDMTFLKSPLPLGGYFGGNEVAPKNLTYNVFAK